MILKWLASFVAAVAVVVSLLELSSLAAERRAACNALPRTADGLFVDVLTPALPVASDVGGVTPPGRAEVTR